MIEAFLLRHQNRSKTYANENGSELPGF